MSRAINQKVGSLVTCVYQTSGAIQFNSIQYRHLYAPANEHHVDAHGEETKLQRKIKYMNEQTKKINQL